MNKKMRARKRRQARRVALTLVLMLTVALVSIGGTLAWLTAQTDEITNTFTVGDINITLTETPNTDTDGDEVDDTWTAKLIPGEEYAKNPTVGVVAGSEECYLFVKATEVNNPSTYLDYSYTMDADNSGWNKLTGVNLNANETVWYRVVDASENAYSAELLTGNKVTVKDDLLKKGTTGTTAPVMPSDNASAPTITFQAYAVQKDNVDTAADAWAKLG